MESIWEAVRSVGLDMECPLESGLVVLVLRALVVVWLGAAVAVVLWHLTRRATRWWKKPREEPIHIQSSEEQMSVLLEEHQQRLRLIEESDLPGDVKGFAAKESEKRYMRDIEVILGCTTRSSLG